MSAAASHSLLPAASATSPGPCADPDNTAGHKNMQQLILLRWMAVLGQVVTIGFAWGVLDMALPLDVMLTLVLALAVFNAISILRLQARRPVANTELFVALLVDVGILTAQLYCSGGISNPFVFLYLLQAGLAAVLLRPWSGWMVVGATVLCMVALSLSSQPLPLTLLPSQAGMGLAHPYTEGLLLCFVLNAVLLVLFITRIQRNLRTRDDHLAALRQRAAEEEHIVRMGLLASGAAHELGTPLSTLAVILGDWQRMPPFTQDAQLQQDIREMQAQVLRCKTIVSGILTSAGEARADAPTATTVHTFLNQLLAQWQKSLPPAARADSQLVVDNRFGPDLRMVADTALHQMICNVLDNAYEASPHWQRLVIARRGGRQGDSLVLTVQDAGAGFAPEILAQLGKPYQSSKGKPGGGLGLFLSMNVARTLGGSLTVRNLARPATAAATSAGAEVSITLPLAALVLEEGHATER